MKKNDLIELTIEDITTDGEGIGHYDGLAFFVKDTVVGDRITANIMKLKKGYGYARLVEIISPSKDRIVPSCPVARSCGGCQLQHMKYEAQLLLKENMVRNNICRIGKIPSDSYIMRPIVGMDEEHRLHYRNKAQYPVGFDKNGNVIIGFYASHSHNIIPSNSCDLAHPLNERVIKTVRSYMEQYNINDGVIRHIMTRISRDGRDMMVCLVAGVNKLPHQEELVKSLRAISEITSVMLNVNTKNTNVIMSDDTRLLSGNPYITDTIGGIRYQISANSFFQVNPYMTQKMYQKVLEYAAPEGNESLWDLYCGIGTISLYLAPHVREVFGVEIVDRAIVDAKNNAKLNNITNANFFTGSAEEVLPAYYEEHKGLTADIIVVDPPRKGCDTRLLDTIVSMIPKKIIYVSCDSATLSRDLAYLTQKGYNLIEATCFDNFVQTMHVETVCLLSKKA